MPLGLPAGEVAALAAALIAGGLVAGLLAGLFGVGGGGILVPVLYEVLGVLSVPEDVRMHLAIGTSFAVILPTTLRSTLAHHARGAVDAGVLRTLGPPLVAGVMIGTVIARFADTEVMQAVWIASAVTIACYLFFGDPSWRLGTQMPGPGAQVPVGLAVGLVATLMGVGGAAYIVPFMTLYGRPVHQAVGTSAGCSTLVAVPALLGFIWAGWGAEGLPAGSLGYVSLIGAAVLTPISILAAPWGVRIAHGLSRRKLELAFAVFMTAVALRFIFAVTLG